MPYQAETESWDAIPWEHPEDAGLPWMRDTTHTPHPTTPFAVDLMKDAQPLNRRQILINGWAFNQFVEPEFHEMSDEDYGGRSGAQGWFDLCLPEVKRLVSALRGRDYAGMTTDELVALIPQIIEESRAIYHQTFRTVQRMMEDLGALETFCAEHFGERGGELAWELSQGGPNESAVLGEELDGLATMARERPPVAAALRAGQFDGLDQLEGGPEVLAELDRILETAGWRGQYWSQIEKPTMAEDPSMALKLVAGYLDAGDNGPLVSRRRALVAAEAALARCLAELSDEGGAELPRLVENGRGSNAARESRAYYQLLATGLPRIPLVELGRRLVKAGALEEPNDLFYLTLEEVPRAVAGELGDTRTRTASLREKYTAWAQIEPPQFLGGPPPALPPEVMGMLEAMFGMPVEQDAGESVIKGIPASKGTVEGTARVIRSLDEIDRLKPGDVLVCKSTAPPWTPMFGIACAVVTDAGGVQSHSAIVAREYAIPCVVSTGAGTSRIPDGSRVRVNGDEGTVEIL